MGFEAAGDRVHHPFPHLQAPRAPIIIGTTPHCVTAVAACSWYRPGPDQTSCPAAPARAASAELAAAFAAACKHRRPASRGAAKAPRERAGLQRCSLLEASWVSRGVQLGAAGGGQARALTSRAGRRRHGRAQLLARESAASAAPRGLPAPRASVGSQQGARVSWPPALQGGGCGRSGLRRRRAAQATHAGAPRQRCP